MGLLGPLLHHHVYRRQRGRRAPRPRLGRPAPRPGRLHRPLGPIADADSVAYLFYDLDEAALSVRGAAAEGEVDGEPGAVLLRILPGSRLLTFPLTFGSTWTDDYELQITPVIEEIRLEQHDTNEVVGWGTLVTPAGSAEALMIRAKTIQTFRIVSTDPDTSFVVDRDSSIAITYVKRDGLAATIELDGAGNVELGS